jgi:hypothetical protein
MSQEQFGARNIISSENIFYNDILHCPRSGGHSKYCSERHYGTSLEDIWLQKPS